MDLARRYEYNLPWIGVIVGTLFYAGLSVWAAHWAAGFDEAAFICLLVPSAVFGWFALVVMTRRLLAPRGFLRTRIARIPYADIIWISEAFARTRRSGGRARQRAHLRVDLMRGRV